MKKRFSKELLAVFFLCFLLLGFSGVAVADDGTQHSLLKTAGALAAALAIVGMAVAGYAAGRTYDSYTGWERHNLGAGQFYNRKPFHKDRPTYGVTDKTIRLKWEDVLFYRLTTIKDLMHPPDGSEPKWVPSMGIEKLPEPLREFFTKQPERFKSTLKTFELMKQQKANWESFKTQFALAEAWSNAHASAYQDQKGEFDFNRFFPPEPNTSPEEWDFRGIRRDKPLPFKSPKHASQLIKKIAHTFGATLVGIGKLNPDWCYQGYLRGVGSVVYDIPAHWEYAIVLVTPHEWDAFYANPTYGTSYDAYSRERFIAGKLETFIHELGYPARSHVPPRFYDMVTPPVAIDAGLGEQGRHGLLITPELGANSRLAVVTTNIPMEVDKPVDLGIMDFCKKCKICAEKCPSGAISHKDDTDMVRGYKRWLIRDELCYHIWASVATSRPRGCRICLAVCPYSRKNNWVHSVSRYVDPRDPTGIAASMLLWLQKTLFKYPKASEFMPPPVGKNATYHEPPDWLQPDKWFDVPRTW
ncbi:MAG: reductive dehalogenase [Deltaproteobacteria bacterium]|nr:reductive dehalogenase [Deltaproteobacteria bacterium]